MCLVRGKDKASESAVMRPGCGLKFREGWFLARHTPPSAPTAGGKDPAAENPKASSTVQTGFALRTLPRWKKKQKKRKRERESFSPATL